MSWFVALLPKNKFENETEIGHYRDLLTKRLGLTPRFSILKRTMILLANGIPETFKHSNTIQTEGGKGWLVCGIGITYEGDSFSIMHENDWDSLLSQRPSPGAVHRINGHYAIFAWDETRFSIYTDVLELRRVYIAETEKYFIVTTRLDWLTSIHQKASLDIGRLAGQWGLANSISDASFIDGVLRVGASGYVSIVNNTLTHSWCHWTPELARGNESVISLIEDAAMIPIHEGLNLTLGLSGGIDSRTLLAILSHSPDERWQIHSCGDRNNLDVHVARMLAESLRIQAHISFFERRPSDTIENVVCSLREVALHEEMTDELFAYPRFQVFSELSAQGFWMIDGGYGEFMRRIYGNKLNLVGRKILREKNAGAAMLYLRRSKSAIFSPEIHRMFRQETRKQLQKALDEMPEISHNDIGAWLDIFHIRYRVKNFPANGQAAYDQVIASYMPFAQPALLSACCSIPSDQRKNNKINRRIIAAGDKKLYKIPLVSSGKIIPYWTIHHILLSYLWSKGKKRFQGDPYRRQRSFRSESLWFLREYILDRLNSHNVKVCSYYNYDFIKRSIEDYYCKDKDANAQVIEDWLAFDFWREILDQPHHIHLP